MHILRYTARMGNETHAERWCSQHSRPRSQCRPSDRHAQTFRASDELMDAVQAIADERRLSRNDMIEMALEDLVGWHVPGEPWKGPRGVRRETLASSPAQVRFKAAQ